MPSIASALHRVKRAVVPISRHMAVNSIIDRITGHPEPEVMHLSRLAMGQRTVIDVGANCGLYTFALAKLFRSVWAFEPNPEVSRPITAARLPNVRLETVALSSERRHATLRLPIVNGQALDGWATLGDNSLSAETVEVNVQTATLDSYQLDEVDFIKIDVEGHELDVLAGARETIVSCRPVCLIEGSATALQGFFDPLRYEIRASLSPQNVLCIPL